MLQGGQVNEHLPVSPRRDVVSTAHQGHAARGEREQRQGPGLAAIGLAARDEHGSVARHLPYLRPWSATGQQRPPVIPPPGLRGGGQAVDRRVPSGTAPLLLRQMARLRSVRRGTRIRGTGAG